MLFTLFYTTALGLWTTFGNINLGKKTHRDLVVRGGIAAATEQVIWWQICKISDKHEMWRQEWLREERVTDRLRWKILAQYPHNTCPQWMYSAFSESLFSEACPLYDAPVPTFDLILAPPFELALIPPQVSSLDDAPSLAADLIPDMPAFSVAPYNHNSILPAALSTIHAKPSFKDSLVPRHCAILAFVCLAVSALVSLLYLKFYAVIGSLLQGRRTLDKNLEEYNACPSRSPLSITIPDMSL
ncbi:hypothetical protein C0995_013591 [Termitomyces sp. Mi166|nr:hypothetical protein C0995_013591 [Termitomyces sp. Mi166\